MAFANKGAGYNGLVLQKFLVEEKKIKYSNYSPWVYKLSHWFLFRVLNILVIYASISNCSLC